MSPTILLVHGAFADAASWSPVTQLLLDQGHTVRAVAGPNRSLTGDAEYLRSTVEQIEGPVLLVGHSYGGCVITVAGVAENVVGLVYAAGYALEVGESIASIESGFDKTSLQSNIVTESYPLPGGSDGTELLVKPEAFPDVFAEGVPAQTARVFAVSQRPFSTLCVTETASAAAWKTKPAWGIVSTRDRTINPEVERFGYERAGMRKVVELEAPHLVMHTHPVEVAALITEAVAELS
ncbi:alpha/beta fold hydrolase [Actinoplanes sp. M2I2]|uniref:alpha/beta fold hydrolase n=1 Tax=Actinoplanes sp. M2I2 TaxID=1734444 RepID=UPI002021480D|nr:alpha/beta hydrolase [Actinoplanes sp. M2I2]